MSSKGIVVPPQKIVFEEKDRINILNEVERVLTSGMIAAGENVRKFEEFWAYYTGCKYAIACSNGGAALELILKAIDVKGKDVLVPTNTFIATVNAIIFAGGTPIFLDTDTRTMGVNLQEIKNKKTDNTAGVIVVHIGGIISPEMEDISNWCRENNIWLVEDAAHAHGSELKGRRAGAFGIAAAYSFFATKVVTSGEGGIIVTGDENIANKCKSLRDYGKISQWVSEHHLVSSNYRISEITAILGLSQSKRLDEFIDYRNKIANTYSKYLKNDFALILPNDRCSWYKYIVVLPDEIDRKTFKLNVKEMGVSLQGEVYEIPVHMQPVFKDEFGQLLLPNSTSICKKHICLPIFYGMSNEQVAFTIECLQKTLHEMRKKI